MAYQNVSQCRFYISYGDWWRSTGITVPRFQTISPNETSSITVGASYSFMSDYTALPSSSLVTGINWFAALNHNVTSDFGFRCKHWISGTQQDIGLGGWDTMVNIGNSGEPTYQGFSLGTWNTPWTDAGTDSVYVGLQGVSGTEPDTSFDVGCWVYGGYYDMPHSPDLSLTLGYETGTKTIETRGGASLSNTMWRPPMWGELGAWELSDPNSPTTGQKLAHSSRRIWNLSFSFLDKTNIFPKYNALNRLIDSNDTLPDDETLLTSDDFFSSVWNKVGTALPFIFQPDKDNNSEFAICKFDQKSFSFQQTAPNLYSVKMKIREVW